MLMSQGVIAACLLVTSVLGCANWQRVTDLSPRAYVEQQEPSEARLTFTDSTQVVLHNLWVTEGSIGSNRERRESSRKLAFPLASVVSSASPRPGRSRKPRRRDTRAGRHRRHGLRDLRRAVPCWRLHGRVAAASPSIRRSVDPSPLPRCVPRPTI
jgi:hypothetical protein